MDEPKSWNDALGKSDLSRWHACACIGPQDGEPVCPCQMRGIVVRDGRYIRPEQDLGPAIKASGSLKEPRQ